MPLVCGPRITHSASTTYTRCCNSGDLLTGSKHYIPSGITPLADLHFIDESHVMRCNKMPGPGYEHT